MDQQYKFKAWQPYEGYQTIAIADDFDAIMWGLEHQVDIFTMDDKLVYSPNDDEEYNFERLEQYGVRCIDDGRGRRWVKVPVRKPVRFRALKNVHWEDWGHMRLVFVAGREYYGWLYEDGELVGHSPYYDVSDGLNPSEIECHQ